MKRTYLCGLLLALLSPIAFSASLVTLPRQLVVDGSGDPRSGAKLYTYVAGTTTPLTSYTTPALTSAHANPVVAVSTGLFPAVYLAATVETFKIVVKDSADVTIYTEDNIPATGFDDTTGLDIFPTTATETAATVTPTDFSYPQGHTRRYGATCDGVADDTVAVQTAINVASEDGSTATVQAGTCLVDTLTIDSSNITITGEGRGSILKASTDIPAEGAIIVSLAGGADAATNQALLDAIYGASVVDARTNVTGSLENVHIKNLSFEGSALTVRGIWMTGFTRGSQISGNYFNNFDDAAIVLNGSWSFSLIANHIKGDGTLGVGMELGLAGNGERSGASVVNAATIIGNEVREHANGVIWNFGVGGTVTGNTFEGMVTDGFASQSVEGISYTGNYHEDNGGDNLQMGGTNGADFAEDWLVSGNYFNANSGNNIRLNGCTRSKIGPNNFGGTVTQHYFIAAGVGQYITDCMIQIPDIIGTYASNASTELNAAYNHVHDGNNTLFRATENADHTFTINSPAQLTYKASGGAGETWTIPANGTVPMPVGVRLQGCNMGGGTLTVAITTDTLNSFDVVGVAVQTGSAIIPDQTCFEIIKIDTAEWVLRGDGVT